MSTPQVDHASEYPAAGVGTSGGQSVSSVESVAPTTTAPPTTGTPSGASVGGVGGGRPLVELDPQGSPVVVSYDVPEPTSYRGRYLIDLGFPTEWFVNLAPDPQALAPDPRVVAAARTRAEQTAQRVKDLAAQQQAAADNAANLRKLTSAVPFGGAGAPNPAADAAEAAAKALEAQLQAAQAEADQAARELQELQDAGGSGPSQVQADDRPAPDPRVVAAARTRVEQTAQRAKDLAAQQQALADKAAAELKTAPGAGIAAPAIEAQAKGLEAAAKGLDAQVQAAQAEANQAAHELQELTDTASSGSDQVPADDRAGGGLMVPSGRSPVTALTEQEITTALGLAKSTGYFDPKVFPGVRAGKDRFGLAVIRQALADLDEATMVAQTQGGSRLVLYRDTSGRCTYRFIPEPLRVAPALLLVESYQLSSFPARFGAGRTIKTFTLLPGEKTQIRVNTYKRSSQSQAQSSSILDSASQDTESDFERSVLAEQSDQDATSKSMEYYADAEVDGGASFGCGSIHAKVDGGVKGATNTSREDCAKNVTNAVAKNAARASSRRDVQVDTSLDTKIETGDEQAVERTLENINLSRTLNFVFRQMNQEFITLLHLTDIRVGYFNGYAESRKEVPLAQLDQLLDTHIIPTQRQAVKTMITAELHAITDYRDQPHDEFIQTRTLTGDTPENTVTYLRVNPDATSTYHPTPTTPPIHVPGVIMAADSHVLRTDAVLVDSFLGRGDALDTYSTGLQTQAVRAREIDNDRHQTDIDRTRLALEIIRTNNTAAAALYHELFPTTPIINQIDHAAITNPNQPTTPIINQIDQATITSGNNQLTPTP